jgi:hypothetical protein
MDLIWFLLIFVAPWTFFWIDAMPDWYYLWWNNREPVRRRRAKRRIKDACAKFLYDAKRLR